jgi:CBS domain-containing protein
VKARDVMVTNVITVGPDSSVRDVADILLMHRISALPVVDKHGKFVRSVSAALSQLQPPSIGFSFTFPVLRPPP